VGFVRAEQEAGGSFLVNALVTGAGGFLGRYIVEHLVARGDRVRGLARGSYPDLEAIGVQMMRGDVRDAATVKAACADVEVVFHTAAVAGIWGEWEYFYQINTVGTRLVVDACLSQGVPKLVFSSSPSVTFDGSEQCGVDESVPYADVWLCHYPHTKALAEQYVLAAHGRNGLATCALRPHLIWGPRDRHLIPRVIERARRKQLRRIGDGQNLIDMVYVENAAQAHIQAADALTVDSPVGGKAYFVSQGTPVNCWDWINQILDLAGLAPVSKAMSLRVAWCAGHILEQTHRILRWQSEPRMTRFLAAQLATSHYFDISAARRDFGYDPHISTDKGMQRLAASLGGG
jgi:nucleoside-diphosphate-sugar epimerase